MNTCSSELVGDSWDLAEAAASPPGVIRGSLVKAESSAPACS